MKSPAVTLPGAWEAIMSLHKSVGGSSVPRATLGLVSVRVSQINGCSLCVDLHSRMLKKLGESDTRIFALAAWREAPYYTEAERAALALAEAATRLSDRADPVGDDIWSEAARHFDESALSALVMSIAVTNLWNRLGVTTRQVSGDWVEQLIAV
jgi:AhpD family alkylhydroperoxidase